MPRNPTILQEFSAFCQSQIQRIENELEARIHISPVAGVAPVRHALGAKKPSLSQMEGEEWSNLGQRS